MPSPPTPIDYQILAALQGVLAAVSVAGGYWHDLAGAVTIGAVSGDDGRPVRVELTWDGGSSAFEGASLRRVAEELRVGVLARTQYTDDTTAARTLAALKLRQDIVRAIEADMSLGVSIAGVSMLDTLGVSTVDVVDESGYQGVAGVALTLRIRYHRTRGTV
ncbi:MAG: hypothetical protein ACO26C_06690 [Ilumatobacteraceae bacterium]